MDKHNIRKGHSITFSDGKERQVYPLTLKQLRRYVPLLDKLNGDIDSLESLDLSVQMCAIMLERDYPEIAKDLDSVADLVDLSIVSQLTAVAMGQASPEA